MADIDFLNYVCSSYNRHSSSTYISGEWPVADLRTIREGVLAVFSRVFPTTRDLSLQVDVSQEDDYLYLDIRLSHQDSSYRLNDLGKIPQKIKNRIATFQNLR